MTQNRELTFAQQAILNRIAQKNATSDKKFQDYSECNEAYNDDGCEYYDDDFGWGEYMDDAYSPEVLEYLSKRSNLNQLAQEALKSKAQYIGLIKFAQTKEMPAQDGLVVNVEHDGEGLSMLLLLKSNKISVRGNLFDMDSKTTKLAQRYNRKLKCWDWVEENIGLIAGGTAIVMLFLLVRSAVRQDKWVNEKVDAYKETLSPDYKKMEQKVEDYRKAMNRAYYKRNREAR